MRDFARSTATALTLAALVCSTAPARANTTIDLSQFLIAHTPPRLSAAAPRASSASSSASQQTNTAQTPTSVVRPANSQLVSGGYTVVAPILTGQSGTISYLRFFNGEVSSETTNVTVVGSPSGNIYGTAQITVPEYASPQYSISTLLSTAGAGPLTGGDTAYLLYLQDPTNSGNNGFQHAYWNSNNGFFDNASVCTYVANEDYSGENQILINVYTTAVPLYPSQINIVNYSTSATYNLTITDANTGQVMGQIGVNVEANAIYSVPFSYFEQQINWTPTSSQFNANMFFEPPSGQPSQLLVSQLIYNSQFGSYVNMSAFCAINPSSN